VPLCGRCLRIVRQDEVPCYVCRMDAQCELNVDEPTT
jgi:hypothetical protein